MVNRFIEKLQGLVELADADLRALDAATNQTQAFGSRQDIIREGDQLGPLLVVLEGWAFRYKVLPNGGRQILAFLIPGDSCDLNIGMLAAMDHGIQTVTPAVVVKIESEAIDNLMERHPRVARAMYLAQLIDESTLRAWIVSLGRRGSAERTAHLLLELYVRGIRNCVAGSLELQLPLSQTILAEALGMTPVHVNRTLQVFQRSGTVDLRRGLLRILDPAALTRLSGFDDNYLLRRLRVCR